MALATWWASDPLVDLSPLSNFQVQLAADDAQLATLNHITVAEVEQRRNGGHRPYLGYVDGAAATYGWVARRQASIGELDLVFPWRSAAGCPEGSGWFESMLALHRANRLHLSS